MDMTIECDKLQKELGISDEALSALLDLPITELQRLRSEGLLGRAYLLLKDLRNSK